MKKDDSTQHVDFTKLSQRIRCAFELAQCAHKGQRDKAGEEYIKHPMFVASSVYPDESAMMVALLHDTVEDTEVTFEQLKDLLTDSEMDALKLLTHDKTVPYMDYVRQISKNPLAAKVKMADLKHNMDLSRLPDPGEKDKKRVEKYEEAYRILLQALKS